MKFIIIFSMMFPLSIFANTDCSKAIDNAKLFCQSSIDQCGDLHECLVRRDTCVDKEPKNETECNNLHSCNQDFKNKFEDKFSKNNSKCEYRWHLPSSGEGLCLVKGHFLFSEEACPGRIDGLLNAAAYGLGSAVDSGFDCKAVKKKYQEKTESCNKSMKEVAILCPDVPSYLNSFKTLKCEYSTKFASYSGRGFSLDGSSSARVNQNGRNAPDNRPPHNDDGGGPSGVGSGSGQ